MKACVVIRPDRSQSIETLRGVLDSLITQQDFPEWEALLAPIEGRPPRRLFNLLAKLADDRVRIILPRGPGARANASDHLYSDVTDSAIRHCSQSSWWLSFSDGSAPFGMDFLRKLDASFDIVADARHAAVDERDRDEAKGDDDAGWDQTRRILFVMNDDEASLIATFASTSVRGSRNGDDRSHWARCSRG